MPVEFTSIHFGAPLWIWMLLVVWIVLAALNITGKVDSFRLPVKIITYIFDRLAPLKPLLANGVSIVLGIGFAIGLYALVGGMIVSLFGFWGDMFRNPEDYDSGGTPSYTTEPSNSSPGYHNVKGYWRGGTYVDPYIRSNPDGNPNNNLNGE